MMKHTVIALLLILLGCSLPTWAATNVIKGLTVFELPEDRVLIKVESDDPPDVEAVDRGKNPAVLFKGCKLQSKLVLNGYLKPDVFVRPPTLNVKIYSPKGNINTWLTFETTRPLLFFVVAAEPAFLNEFARELPVYPAFPAQKNAVNRDQKTQWKIIRQVRELPDALPRLEALYYSTKNPDKALLSELFTRYKQEKDTIKAFALSAEGVRKFPDLLGLPYSAYLYQYHQPSKAIDILSDLVMMKQLPKTVKAQAYYMMGSIQTEKHEYENAVNSLKMASEVYGTNPTVLYNLGVAYEASERKQEAQATYEKALAYANADLKAALDHRIAELKSPNYKGIDLTPIEFDPYGDMEPNFPQVPTLNDSPAKLWFIQP